MEGVGRIAGRVAPWASLAGGVATALLWRRGIDHVRGVLVLASALGGVALLHVGRLGRGAPADRSEPGWRRRVDEAAVWGAVNLAQSGLWLALPFYAMATTWSSGNALFTVVLLGLAIVSCFDRTMREHVLARDGLAISFVAISTLAVAQLVLPVVLGLAPRHAALLAGAAAALAGGSFVAFEGASGGWSRRFAPGVLGRGPRRAALARLALLAVLGAIGTRLLLPWIPPAPLRLASATFALGRDGLDPRDPVVSLPAGPGSAFVFVAIEAPRGLRESVQLEVDDGAPRERRPLEILGGRAGGYRLWTDVHLAGARRVRASVRTLGGQIVGRLTASVAEERAP